MKGLSTIVGKKDFASHFFQKQAQPEVATLIPYIF
jgi:hypothetical protein